MPMWLFLAALASAALTLLLIWVLWRMNTPLRRGGDSAHAEGDAGKGAERVNTTIT